MQVWALNFRGAVPVSAFPTNFGKKCEYARCSMEEEDVQADVDMHARLSRVSSVRNSGL